MNKRGLLRTLRGMRRKREWKMPLRGPVFAQFSAGALKFFSKYPAAWIAALIPIVPYYFYRIKRLERERQTALSGGNVTLRLL